MRLTEPTNEEMDEYWRAATRSGFLRLLDLFLNPDIAFCSQEHRDYAKSCVISNAIELKATSLLPHGWVAWWTLHGRDIHRALDVSWMRHERWANLDRLNTATARA